MRNRTMLLMCSLVYFLYAVVGVADAGPFPQSTTFPPPSFRLSIVCTSEQTLGCLTGAYTACTGTWPFPSTRNAMDACQLKYIKACRLRCGDDPEPSPVGPK